MYVHMRTPERIHCRPSAAANHQGLKIGATDCVVCVSLPFLRVWISQRATISESSVFEYCTTCAPSSRLHCPLTRFLNLTSPPFNYPLLFTSLRFLLSSVSSFPLFLPSVYFLPPFTIFCSFPLLILRFPPIRILSHPAISCQKSTFSRLPTQAAEKWTQGMRKLHWSPTVGGIQFDGLHSRAYTVNSSGGRRRYPGVHTNWRCRPARPRVRGPAEAVFWDH